MIYQGKEVVNIEGPHLETKVGGGTRRSALSGFLACRFGAANGRISISSDRSITLEGIVEVRNNVYYDYLTPYWMNFLALNRSVYFIMLIRCSRCPVTPCPFHTDRC